MKRIALKSQGKDATKPSSAVAFAQGKDATKTSSAVAFAPSYAPELSSFQVERSEQNNNSQKAKTRSSAQSDQQARKKTITCKEEYSSDETSEYDEETETQPGAYGIAGLKTESGAIEEDQPTVDDGSTVNLENDGVHTSAILIEADLAPELTSAEEVNIQEEEEMIVQKKQYQRVLFFVMVFYVLAIIGFISGFVLLFVSPLPAHGRLYNPLWYGLVEAVIFLLVATCVILIPTRLCCCSSMKLEDYAPDDKQLLRHAQIASVASFCTFIFVAIPIIVCLPNLQWLGYATMTWIFAGTVFASTRVLLLRRSKETRPKNAKFLWILFVFFFLGLTGATIWRCLNPIYPDCYVPKASWIGDGWCQGEPYNAEACGYDGGDCVEFLEAYPHCNVRYPLRVGDGSCDGGPYNTMECGYDGGDCAQENIKDFPDCKVPTPSRIGDGKCDGRIYGTVECGFDGGDCLGPGERCRGNKECASEVCNAITKVCNSVVVSDLYPNCSVAMPDWIGDGECDGGYYASKACGFDGGDCLELGKACLQDTECASGFCNEVTKLCYKGVLEYPDCIVDVPRRIGDGKCDGGAYASELCGYDGGDCLNPLSISASATLCPTFHITAIAIVLSSKRF